MNENYEMENEVVETNDETFVPTEIEESTDLDFVPSEETDLCCEQGYEPGLIDNLINGAELGVGIAVGIGLMKLAGAAGKFVLRKAKDGIVWTCDKIKTKIEEGSVDRAIRRNEKIISDRKEKEENK